MGKINLIIDCDTGIDDAIAILMASLSPKINLIGLSVCAGNTSLDKAYANTKRVLYFLGDTSPVVKGQQGPLSRGLVTSSQVHSGDGFGGLAQDFDRAYDFTLKEEPGLNLEEFYSQAFKSYMDVSILALGPLTNIATLIKNLDPRLFRTSRLVSMGGAYKVSGNITPLAEYNYWVDPEAAAYVFDKWPQLVEVVGLDVSHKIILGQEEILRLKETNPRLGSFIEKLTRTYRDKEGQRGSTLHDPLALATFLDEDLLAGFKAHTGISTRDQARGALLVDRLDKGGPSPNSLVYDQVDPARFFDLLNEALGTKK